MGKKSPMAKVIRAGGKKRPLTMKEFEKTPQDRKADKAGLAKLNKERKSGR